MFLYVSWMSPPMPVREWMLALLPLIRMCLSAATQKITGPARQYNFKLYSDQFLSKVWLQIVTFIEDSLKDMQFFHLSHTVNSFPPSMIIRELGSRPMPFWLLIECLSLKYTLYSLQNVCIFPYPGKPLGVCSGVSHETITYPDK